MGLREFHSELKTAGTFFLLFPFFVGVVGVFKATGWWLDWLSQGRLARVPFLLWSHDDKRFHS